MYPKALILYAVIAALTALQQLPSISASLKYMRQDRSPLFEASTFVRSLDNDSFSAMLNDTHIVWLVDFYSPWCPHCRQFAPEWEEAAIAYEYVANVQFGAVDCTKQDQICNQEGIYSYPGVKMYHVPPKTVEAITIPEEDVMYARFVAEWIEQMLKENNMHSGIDVDEVYLKSAFHHSRKKKEMYFGNPVEPLYDDQSISVRLKRLRDAGSTVLFTFEDAFFMGTTILEGERYEAAMTWVQALASSFPLKENRDALEGLVKAMKEQKRWKQADWNELIKRWKVTANAMSYPANLFANKDDAFLCTTLTCGFWTLFHMLTVSDVGSEVMSKPWKPSEILAAIRLMVQHFFGCEECKRHFLEANPESVVKKLALSDEDGPHAVAMWIWRMHNVVNEVLNKPLWPTRLSCPHCYGVDHEPPLSLDQVQLNEDEIVAYIRSIYTFDDKLKLEQRSAMMIPWLVPMQLMATVILLLVLFGMLLYQSRYRLKEDQGLKKQDHIA